MLDLGPDHRDAPIDLRVERVQWATLRGLAHDTPDLAWTPERGLAFGADITLVRPDRGFLAVQKLIPDLAVMQLGGRGVEAPKFDSKTDKRLISFRPNGQKCYNTSAVRRVLAG